MARGRAKGKDDKEKEEKKEEAPPVAEVKVPEDEEAVEEL